MSAKLRPTASVAAATALLLLSLSLAPGEALASSEEGGGASALLWQAVNFALLLIVIFFAAREPVVAFFANRRDGIKKDIDQASELLRDAELHYGEWQRKLVDLEQELASIRETARSRSEAEGAHIIAEAEAAAERIKRDAKAAIEQEIRRAKGELALEASAISIELATTLLRDQVNDGDRDRLMDEFISSVERAPADSRAER